MHSKFSRVVTQDDRTQPTKPRDAQTTWSRDKSKTLYLHIHKTHGPQNIAGSWFTMRESHPKIIVTLRSCHHVTTIRHVVYICSASSWSSLAKTDRFQMIVKLDFPSLEISLHLVYKFTCSNCNAIYYGKSERHFFIRGFEHLSMTPLTGKRVKNPKKSTVFDHILLKGHI